MINQVINQNKKTPYQVGKTAIKEDNILGNKQSDSESVFSINQLLIENSISINKEIHDFHHH